MVPLHLPLTECHQADTPAQADRMLPAKPPPPPTKQPLKVETLLPATLQAPTKQEDPALELEESQDLELTNLPLQATIEPAELVEPADLAEPVDSVEPVDSAEPDMELQAE